MTEKQSQWVIKNTEVIRGKFEYLWIVTRLFAFNDWTGERFGKCWKFIFKQKLSSTLCLTRMPS